MTDPIVTFYRLIPDCRAPKRGDRSVGGTVPTRAYRYCEPLCQASSFGWYLFPPMNFSLKWEGGRDIWWQSDADDEWHYLDSIQYPGFARYFDERVPAEAREYSPPFLTNGLEPGLVQIWTGYIARTIPSWSLLVRPVANLARSQNYDLYEGIVETDRWFGPLFTNIQLKRTDVPIIFSTDIPLVQVQPVRREIYAGSTLDDFKVVGEIDDLTAEDWECYGRTVSERMKAARIRGEYAVSARKRAKNE